MNKQHGRATSKLSAESGFAHILLLIIVLAVVACGAYYFGFDQGFEKSVKNNQPVVSSPTPTATLDEMANWKTYDDTELSFSFQYPSVWYSYKLTIPNPERNVTVFSNEKVTKFSDLSREGIMIAIYSSHGSIGASLYGGKEIIVGNKNAWRLLTYSDTTQTSKTVIAEEDVLVSDLGLSINLVSPYPNALSDNKQIFDEIISTFKFTD